MKANRRVFLISFLLTVTTLVHAKNPAGPLEDRSPEMRSGVQWGHFGAKQATGRLKTFSSWSDSNVQTITECTYGRAHSANFPACQHSRGMVPGRRAAGQSCLVSI